MREKRSSAGIEGTDRLIGHLAYEFYEPTEEEMRIVDGI